MHEQIANSKIWYQNKAKHTEHIIAILDTL